MSCGYEQVICKGAYLKNGVVIKKPDINPFYYLEYSIKNFLGTKDLE